MNLTTEQLDSGATHAALVGRLDIEGAQAVEMKLSVLGGSSEKLIVDLSGVTFLASMGLRALMMCARAIAAKNRKMVIVGAQPNVEKVLRASGIDEVVEVLPDLAAGKAALG